MGIGCVQGTAQVGAAGQVGATGGGQGHGPELVNPARDDPRFLRGSTGPIVGKNDAPLIEIPDGEGFGGIKGRKQNAGDKEQNRYSTTDANFYPSLGLLPADPDTGKPMTYVQHIQAYNAAGYISTFHPEMYAKLVEQQNAGNGTVLGSALYAMGVVQKPDAAAQAAGVGQGALATEAVPGSGGALNARQVVMSGTDITGQQWARPHHAESAWAVYRQLVESGLDWKTSMVLSGDDSVSGSGRLNGFNNQNGTTGLNADERAVYRLAAQVQQATGVNAVGIMAGGHAHTGLDDSAKTNPRINKLIGFAKTDRSGSPERMQAIAQSLLNGTVGGDQNTFDKLGKFEVKAKGAFAGASGGGGVIDQIREGDEAAHPKQAEAAKAAAPAGAAAAAPTAAPVAAQAAATGGGGAMPPVNAAIPAAGEGCMGAIHGVAQLGGYTGAADTTALLVLLQTLLAQLTLLVAQMGDASRKPDATSQPPGGVAAPATAAPATAPPALAGVA